MPSILTLRIALYGASTEALRYQYVSSVAPTGIVTDWLREAVCVGEVVSPNQAQPLPERGPTSVRPVAHQSVSRVQAT